MTQALTLDLDGGEETLILRRLEVYNWGPFADYHDAEVDPRGTAIIGPTGSGKTTLVDALMTLIVNSPKYNLASTGGHDSDRDLMSYVRGKIGQGNDLGDNAHIARPGRTITGLSATFARPGRQIVLAAILWTDGTSMSAADCKKRWILYEGNEESIENWLTIQRQEGGARALKRHANQHPKLWIDETKRTYLARVRNLFDIGENAFGLLNRAAGLKQLDSVDKTFRQSVLDDRSGFKRTAEVVAEFGQLAEIRAELETARSQQAALEPLVALNDQHQQAQNDYQREQTLKTIIPVWFAIAGVRLWSATIDDLENKITTLSDELDTLTTSATSLAKQAEELRATYLKLGGASVEALDKQIETGQRFHHQLKRQLHDAISMVDQLRQAVELDTAGLSAKPTKAELAEVHHAIKHLRPELERRQNKLEQQFQQSASEVGHDQQNQRRLNEELLLMKSRPGSNIPIKYQNFRSDLADAVSTNEQNLPFVAEMVAVKPEERKWRGAIERAIGGHRLRILIAPDLLDSALRWVNSRHNALHVRLEAATDDDIKSGRRPFTDSFLHKLDLKDHPHSLALRRLLLSIDRHCVASPEALRSVEHGLTTEGLLSGRQGRFEKRDQQRLDQGWVTGFDNAAQVSELESELNIVSQSLNQARQR